MINTKTIIKPYYNQYTYRIRYNKIGGFTERFLKYALGLTKHTTDSGYWLYWAQYYIDKYYPSSLDEYTELVETCTRLSLLQEEYPKRIKIVHNKHSTLAYFTDEEVFEKCKKIGKKHQIEYSLPYSDNLLEMNNDLLKEEELRKTLYFKKYEYKVFIDLFNHDLESIDDFLTSLKDSEDVHFNSALAAYFESIRAKFYYTDYIIYCKDRDTLTYVLLMGSSIIKSYKRAVPLSDHNLS